MRHAGHSHLSRLTILRSNSGMLCQANAPCPAQGKSMIVAAVKTDRQGQAPSVSPHSPAKSSNMGSMRASTPPSRASTMPVRMMTTRVLFGTLAAAASHSATDSAGRTRMHGWHTHSPASSFLHNAGTLVCCERSYRTRTRLPPAAPVTQDKSGHDCTQAAAASHCSLLLLFSSSHFAAPVGLISSAAQASKLTLADLGQIVSACWAVLSEAAVLAGTIVADC